MTTTNPPAAQAGSYRVGDLDLNRIGYGAMQLAGPGVFGPPRDRAAPIEVLRTAVELGVNHIDTADAVPSERGQGRRELRGRSAGPGPSPRPQKRAGVRHPDDVPPARHRARRYPGFAEYARQTAGVRTIPVLELKAADLIRR